MHQVELYYKLIDAIEAISGVHTFLNLLKSSSVAAYVLP